MTPFAITGYGAYRPAESRPSNACDAVPRHSEAWTEVQFAFSTRGVASPAETSSLTGTPQPDKL